MPRQVAHALLTRPPLSLIRSTRRLPSSSSVRLECVMHAASVHPEPGSNSRINCIKITLPSVPICSSFLSSFFYFCLSSILFQNFTRSFFALFFCFRFVLLQSLVVQFSMTDFCCPLESLQLYYSITNHFVCQAFFITFLNFFRLPLWPSRLRPCYITTSFSFCQYPFLSFFDFFIFFLKKY